MGEKTVVGFLRVLTSLNRPTTHALCLDSTVPIKEVTATIIPDENNYKLCQGCVVYGDVGPSFCFSRNLSVKSAPEIADSRERVPRDGPDGNKRMLAEQGHHMHQSHTTRESQKNFRALAGL